MNIGIISNSASMFPLIYQLAANRLQVEVFYSLSHDQNADQRVMGFLSHVKIPYTEEKNVNVDVYKWLDNHHFDACFILGYGHLLSTDKLGSLLPIIFNIHFGLLPDYRGPSPVFWQLKKGVEHLGVSIHQLSPKFDNGPIIWNKEIQNKDYFNCETANQYLSNVCIEGVFFILNLLANHIPVVGKKMDSQRQAYYHKPILNDIFIQWDKMGAKEICDLVRACNPWNRGAITCLNGHEMKLLDAVISINKPKDEAVAGEIVEDNELLTIRTCDKFNINVNMVFYNDSYVPSYYCRYYGIVKGLMIGK
jgi:methionyl-tRNA formyltransferase